MTDEQRAQIVAVIATDSVDAAERYLDGTDLVFDLASTIAVAHA